MIANTLTVAVVLTVLFFHETLGRSIDTPVEQAPTQTDSLLLAQLQLVNAQQADHASRIKRQSYGSSDYYNNYYNDYYNNYYANQNKGNAARRGPPPAPAPVRSTAERFDDNQVDSNFDSFDRGDSQNGNTGPKYVYTPLFQYKSTHGKHQKLFVPNIFG